jgi:hypothetical protein
MAEPIVHIPEGFQVYGNTVIGYLDGNDKLHLNINAPVIQIPSEEKKAVIAAMPECVPGTIVFLPGFTGMWQYDASGNWTSMT